MPALGVGQVPLALEEGERVLVPVDDAERVDLLLEGAGIESRALDPASDRVGEPLDCDLGAVLVPQTVLQDLELERSDRAEDGIAQTAIAQGEDLDGAFLRELEEALLQLLAFQGVLA